MEIKEIKNERRYKKSAVENHSIRKYECEGSIFCLDKTLDKDMPFYQLSTCYNQDFLCFLGKEWQNPIESGIMATIALDDTEDKKGKETLWGGGLSWKQAEEIAFSKIKDYIGLD